MANNVCRTGLHSQRDNPVGSLGNSLSDAHPSTTTVQEADGPGATRNLVVNVGNQLPQTAGTLPQTNEAVGNNLQGAAEQISNPSTLNGATVDVNNLLVTSVHDTMQQGGMGGLNNSQFRLFGSNDDLLNPSAGMLHTAQAGGAGDETNEEFNGPLEDGVEESEDSDQDIYAKFTPAELLNRLNEYKKAYRTVWQHRNATALEVEEFRDE